MSAIPPTVRTRMWGTLALAALLVVATAPLAPARDSRQARNARAEARADERREAEAGDSSTRQAAADPEPGGGPTIAAPRPRGSITIVKDARPDSPQDFTFTGNLGSFTLDDDPASATPRQITFSNLRPGVYNITEPDLGAGAEPYELENIVCNARRAEVNRTERHVQIRLDPGENATCTFINVGPAAPPPPPAGQARITIVKNAIPDSPQNFEFTGNLGPFVLDDDPDSGTPRRRTFVVDPGTYTVTEPDLGAGAEPYELTDIDCTGGATDTNVNLRHVVIDVEAGDEVTCTFVNVGPDAPPPPAGRAAITIAKDAIPDSPQDFAFVGDLGPFVLDDDPASATPRRRTFFVDPGRYAVRELPVALFELVGIECSGGDGDVAFDRRQVVVDVDAGDRITCVFTNRGLAPPPPPPGRGSITIVKDALPNSRVNFVFAGDLGTFSLDDDRGSPLPRGRTFGDLVPGRYRVAELVPAGWRVADIDCADATGGTGIDLDRALVSIGLSTGDSVVCVFRNRALGRPGVPGPGPGPGGGAPGPRPGGGFAGGGLAATGLAVGSLLALGASMLAVGGGLTYAGRHRSRRGRHRAPSRVGRIAVSMGRPRSVAMASLLGMLALSL